MNQEKNRTFRIFSHRTEVLAEKIGRNLHEMEDVLGISKRMLFGYRSGNYPISDKAWRKLEAAEKAAGIDLEEPKPAAEIPKDDARIATLEEKIDRLTGLVEMLIEQTATSSPGHGRAVASKAKNSA